MMRKTLNSRPVVHFYTFTLLHFYTSGHEKLKIFTLYIRYIKSLECKKITPHTRKFSFLIKIIAFYSYYTSEGKNHKIKDCWSFFPRILSFRRAQQRKKDSHVDYIGVLYFIVSHAMSDKSCDERQKRETHRSKKEAKTHNTHKHTLEK